MAKVDPEPVLLTLRCMELGVRVRDALAEALIPTSITPEQHQVLSLLAAGASSPGEICLASGRDKTTVSRVLARATRAGLVVQERRDDDRRRQRLRLTARGVAKQAESQRLLERAAPKALAALSPRDRRRLSKILGKLRADPSRTG